MGKLNLFQNQLFKEVKLLINDLISDYESLAQRNQVRLTILESCSSKIGGFSINEYYNIVRWDATDTLDNLQINKIVCLISKIPLPPSVSLSILSVDEFETQEQRATGAYYTDFRLSSALVEPVVKNILFSKKEFKVIDLASGSGILLSTLASLISKEIPVKDFLTNSIFGCDISDTALRAVCLSLSCMTDDITVISSLHSHLIHIDSLTANNEYWNKLMPEGFDYTVGNPPWEKLKITTHEYLKANGDDRHYGQEIDHFNKWNSLTLEKTRLKDYAASIRHLTHDNQGEIDLYMPFMKLAYNITKVGGYIAQIIPAAFIRTQSAKSLRRHIIFHSELINITLLDNKAKFFDIDTRFKFLLLNGKKGEECQSIILNYGSSNGTEIKFSDGVKINIEQLSRIRPDLSLPEVRNNREWDLFSKISNNYPTFGKEETLWQHTFHREIDMTLDKNLFGRQRIGKVFPLIEGRMVHQFVYGAKAYISGSGRKAIWEESHALNTNDLRPQFFVYENFLPKKILDRTKKSRVGFCDITGQTNERTFLASIIPSGSICGNKVPTIDFYFDKIYSTLPYLWLGIANSFVFDWILRRIITTNANFFIIDSIPIPEPDASSSIQENIIEQTLSLTNSSLEFSWRTAEIRAKIDALVAILYDTSYEDYLLILDDFTSIDRIQPYFEDDEKSTVTRDLALLSYLELVNPNHADLANLKKRIDLYKKIGAVPYVPSQFKNLAIHV